MAEERVIKKVIQNAIVRGFFKRKSKDEIREEVIDELLEIFPTTRQDILESRVERMFENEYERFEETRKKSAKEMRDRINKIRELLARGAITEERARDLIREAREAHWKRMGPEYESEIKKLQEKRKKQLEEEKLFEPLKPPWEKKEWGSLSKNEQEYERYKYFREENKKLRKELKKKHGVSLLKPWTLKKPKYKEEFEKKKFKIIQKPIIGNKTYNEIWDEISNTPEFQEKYRDVLYQMDKLKEEYKKGNISDEDYNRHYNDLKKALREIDNEVHKRTLQHPKVKSLFGKRKIFLGIRRAGPPKAWKEAREKWSEHVQKTFMVLIFTILGVVTASFLHSMYFFLGFLFWSMYLVIPEGEPPKFEGKVIITWKQLMTGNYFRNANAGLGLLRAISKATSIMLFVWAIKTGTVPFQSIALIAVAFIGYYSFKGTYDPTVPSSIIEALVRFGIGAIVIPFWIFYSIFNSLVLTFIALAFFAIPPIAEEKGESESYIFVNYFMFDRIWFAILMFIALAGAGVIPGLSGLFGGMNWGLTGTLKATFLYFWLITFVSGFFSSPATRPVTGIFMLGSAVIIYGLGPGMQDVGSALFGPWFPTVYKTVNNIMKPIGDVFNQIGNTFGTAITLLVNPMAFAQSMMNGTYASDPTTGLKGPLGVEIEDFWTTPIYPYQPYQVIIKIKNKGAFDARNVTVSLYVDKEIAPKEQTTSLRKARIVLGEIGIVPGGADDVKIECFDKGGFSSTDPEQIVRCVRSIDPDNNDLVKMDVRQIFFNSPGIPCETIEKYALRERRFKKKQVMYFVPLIGEVEYDYDISSTLDLEFISKAEWDRRVREEEEFITQQKRPATLTNAPVQLNIDSLEQPIREGTPFFIGLGISSAQPRGEIKELYNLTLKLPPEIAENLESCTIPYEGEPIEENGYKTLVWTHEDLKGQSMLYCRFKALDFSKLQTNGSTKTFLIKADAEYRFKQTDTEILTVDFGGGCCRGGCPPGLECNWKPGDTEAGQCVPKEQLEAEEEEQPTPKLGDPNYCAWKKEQYEDDPSKWCIEGQGGCKSGECNTVFVHNGKHLKCFQNLKDPETSEDIGIGLCCYEDRTEECVNNFKRYKK
jgi:hypothetical protein